METYNGLVRTPTDAIILFEACRLGLLPRVQRRLSEKERQSIRSGSVFVWDEREAGMRRWTDGKSWSASRVSGSFLTYREMEGKRGGNTFVSPGGRGTKTPDSADDPAGPDGEEGPDGYRYKPDGLMKQSFSITTSQGQHLHLISYYSRSSPTAQVLRQPSNDPSLSSIQPAKGMYPEAAVDQSNVPAVTRSPMAGAPGYVMAPSPGFGRPPPHHPHAYMPPAYIPHPAYMAYPLSPMATPPPYALHAYPPGAGLPPLGYPAGPYGQPHPLHLNQVPPSAYDTRPLRGPEGAPAQQHASLHHQRGGPPAPYSHSQPPPPVSQSYYPHQSFNHPPPSATEPSTAPQDADSGKSVAALQIDPRLTQPLSQDRPTISGRVAPGRPEEVQEVARPSEGAPPVAASQAPTIGALVNSTAPAGTEVKPHADAEKDRQASTSPGGTKNGAPPQDIPSEKLGFREDKRALSMLDRAFARV